MAADSTMLISVGVTEGGIWHILIMWGDFWCKGLGAGGSIICGYDS